MKGVRNIRKTFFFKEFIQEVCKSCVGIRYDKSLYLLICLCQAIRRGFIFFWRNILPFMISQIIGMEH